MTNKITRNATTTTSTNGNNASSVQMYAKVLAPSGDTELAKVKRPVKTATKTVATKALPVADNAALEIRLNALASMLRGLNDRIDALEFVHIGTYADDMASVRCDISELKAALTDANPFETASRAIVDSDYDADTEDMTEAYTIAAACVLANYSAGYVNNDIQRAATKQGKGTIARVYLKTAENRAFKNAVKVNELSLNACDAVLDSMVFAN